MVSEDLDGCGRLLDLMETPDVFVSRCHWRREPGYCSSAVGLAFELSTLSDTTGTVLDPVVSLRRRMRVAPGATARLDFWGGVAPTRAQALACAGKLRAIAAFDRAQTLAAARARAALDELKISSDEALEFQRMASGVLYLDSARRAEPEILSRNRSGQPVLWVSGISGDLPLVLVEIENDGGLPSVERMLRAHAYWRSKRLAADLVILNGAADAAALAGKLQAAVDASPAGGRASSVTVPGAVFLIRGDTLPEASRELFRTAARVLIAAQPDTAARIGAPGAGAAGETPVGAGPDPAAAGPRPHLLNPPGRAEALGALPALEFFNGLGGFAAGGREYVTILQEGAWTPAPWTNVIANAQFGFLASADGTGTTWSINAQQNQLTPWSNDPVSNAPAEVVYLRDEDSGDLWSATPLPIREPTSVLRGASRLRLQPVRARLARHRTRSSCSSCRSMTRSRSRGSKSSTARAGGAGSSITHYVEWVLGNQRSRSAPFIITEIDPGSSALLARNPWSVGFSGRASRSWIWAAGSRAAAAIARSFSAATARSPSPRRSLIANPRGSALSDRVGGGLDPCGALQAALQLGARASRPRSCCCSDRGASDDAARALVEKYRSRRSRRGAEGR